MRARRQVRAAGAMGHLLLVVVLALGVFVMHTVGHPRESSHATMSTVSHTQAMRADTSHTADPGHGNEPAATGGVLDDAGLAATSASSSSHEPAMAMDMLSLCMAVLFGAWVITALLASAFARRRERSAGLLARIVGVPRPDPPPRGPDLTRLSVLRL
ncbi:DUF6153 family protein [Streptomyces sp. NPDC004082]|uniref:hypothetical protein n=1 Tax=unclassified Streptomyces TaxID=2593676 RepID=UPI0033BF2BBE